MTAELAQRRHAAQRRLSRSSGSTARASSRSSRCAGRRSCSTSGPPGAARAGTRCRCSSRRRSAGRARNVVFVGVDVKDFSGDARAFLERLRGHVPQRVRRQGLDDRPLRRHRLSRDVLHRRERAGALPHRRPGRGGRATSTRGSSGRSHRREAPRVVARWRWRSPARRAASESRPTPAELESELVCPVCETTLDTSDAPVARRMKAFIRARIAAGDTKSEIKAKLVDQFGTGVLAVPPREGLRPASPGCCRSPGSAVGLVVVGGARLALEPRPRRRRCRRTEPARSWSAASTPRSSGALDDELVRFEAHERHRGRRLPSAPASSRSSRRVCCRSFPATSRRCRPSRRSGWASRVLPDASSSPASRSSPGSSASSSLLGAGAAAIGLSITRNQFLLEQVAGFILIVFGFVFMGLLPWPQRLVGAGLVQGARRRGSGFLLGGAFAVCAAPCIGPVLGSILVLAGDSDTVLGRLAPARRLRARARGPVPDRRRALRARDGAVPPRPRPLRRDPVRERPRSSSRSARSSSPASSGGCASI